MNETTNNCRASRAHNPFDDGARERLRRMELLTETGSIKASALIALAPVSKPNYSSCLTQWIVQSRGRNFCCFACNMTAYPKSFLIPFGGSAGHLRSRANLQDTLSGT